MELSKLFYEENVGFWPTPDGQVPWIEARMAVIPPAKPGMADCDPFRTFLPISLIQSSNRLKLRWWALALNVTPAEACSDHVC